MLSKAPVTTILPVIDMNRAREFYERKLGLKPMGFAADGNFIFACAGEATIALIQKPQGTKNALSLSPTRTPAPNGSKTCPNPLDWST